ncbi:MAG: sigma-70 family RNA polymerase sigma factor [Actinomycetota bacterium]|nr:sigma-70 family RNA polymerase sigma factor [Actinomycetota bacterium]
MPTVPSSDERFRRVFDAHGDPIRRYCHRRLEPEDAADATAEVFTVAWRRLDVVPEGDAARLWLFGVARNVVAKAQRTTRRRDRLLAKAMSIAQDYQESPELQVVRRAEDEAIIKALDRLNADDREILLLRTWEELDRQDTAASLGISLAAADKRFSRALRRLERVLARPTTRTGPSPTEEGGKA